MERMGYQTQTGTVPGSDLELPLSFDWHILDLFDFGSTTNLPEFLGF